MYPTLSALFCLGLRLGQVIHAQMDLLPKPSLQALPSPLVPLNKPVTLRCQGPPGVDLYRLEKLKPRNHEDEAVLFIPAMKRSSAGQYRCLYQNGSRWSPPSKLLELVATGFYPKPSLLSAQSSPAVSPGGDVTLQCQSKPGFDQYVLYTDGDSGPHKGPERWYRADFPIITVTAAHSGTYKCYSFKRSSPYLWSAPSDPLELVVTGTVVTARQLSAEAPFSVTGMLHTTKSIKPTEMARRRTTTTMATTLTTTNVGVEEISEPSRNITIFPGGSGSPTGLTGQYYTVGNLVRICFGIVILIFLVGFLAEDWHSWKKSPLRRVRAVHRPLPPLPQTQKSLSCQDRGRPDGHNHGCHH